MGERSGRHRATRRVVIAGLGGLVIGASSAAGVVESRVAAEGRRPPKGKIVRRHFYQTNAIIIPATGPAAPFPSTVEVSGFRRGQLRFLRIYLMEMNHSRPADLDLMLESPDGTRVKFWSDAGATDGLNFSYYLHDDAREPLPASGPFNSVTYTPTDYDTGPDFTGAGLPGDTTNVAFRSFRGIDPNGTWKLWVVDDTAGNAGTIAGGWELDMDVWVPRQRRRRRRA